MLSNNDTIAYLYNSNMLDGIKKSLINYNNPSPVAEIQGHKNALEYILKNNKEKITELKISKLHKLITKDLLEPEFSGTYRNMEKYTNKSIGIWPLKIKPEMKEFVKQANKAKSLDDAWSCHHQFQRIQPFVNVNGIISRLLLNWVCLRNNLPLQIVMFENKNAYEHQIKLYQVEQDYINNNFWGKN